MSNKEIYCSLQYGYANVKSNQYNEDEAGKSYDICDELGSNIINYRLKKIIYTLSEKDFIVKIKMEYINKNDKTQKTFETPTWEGLEGSTEEYELDDDEEITNVNAYLKNNTLVGFEIFTNKDKNKKIGFCDQGQPVSEDDMKEGGKIVCGFAFSSSKQYGVYGISFYYIDK